MPIPRRYTTDAIVLSRFDLGEADRVLTLITPTGGKLKAIAKGIRRPDLAARRQPRAVRRADRRAGARPDVRRRHPGQRRPRLAQPARFARVARPPPGTSPSWPTARSRSATRPSRSTRCCDARTSCSTRGWRPAGSRAGTRCTCSTNWAQRPEVDRCVECDRVLEADERFRWVPPLGGVLCERCPGPPHDRAGLSLEALKLLKAYQRLDIEAIAALRLAPAVERETEAAMREFVRGALERDARSLAFLDEVRHVPRPADGHGRAPVTSTPRPTARAALERLATRTTSGWLTHGQPRRPAARARRSGSCGRTVSCGSTRACGPARNDNIARTAAPCRFNLDHRLPRATMSSPMEGTAGRRRDRRSRIARSSPSTAGDRGLRLDAEYSSDYPVVGSRRPAGACLTCGAAPVGRRAAARRAAGRAARVGGRAMVARRSAACAGRRRAAVLASERAASCTRRCWSPTSMPIRCCGAATCSGAATTARSTSRA